MLSVNLSIFLNNSLTETKNCLINWLRGCCRNECGEEPSRDLQVLCEGRGELRKVRGGAGAVRRGGGSSTGLVETEIDTDRDQTPAVE